MLESEAHINFSENFPWGGQEGKKNPALSKKCSDYYAFGLLMPGRSSTSSANNEYKFTGHELDDEAGLNIYYMIARGYDPVLGRFMQIDPMSHLYPSSSPYIYALNNPLMYVDPTGETVECSTKENCEKAAADFNTVVEGAGVTVVENQKTVTKGMLWWKTEETVTTYQLSTDESDFDFSQSDDASALFDVINSDEIEYWAVYESDDFVPSGSSSSLFETGGGFTDDTRREPNQAVMYISENNRLGIPRAANTFHEIVGHGHPNYQQDRALRNLDIRIQNTMQYRLKGPRGFRHGGFNPQKLPTYKINLYKGN